MSYFKARRKRGACYGSLWKQHSTGNTQPTNILNSLYTFHNDEEDEESPLKIINDDDNDDVASSSTLTNTTINNNEKTTRIKVNIRNKAGVETLTAALGKNERGKCYEFCVLIGNTLTGYENLTAFRRGDHPTSEIRIVGASAWNPTNDSSSYSSPSSPLSSSNHNNSNSTPTFRLLTNAGTHIYCAAQTCVDRDIWLAALHSGLEITYAGFHDTLCTLSSLSSSSSNHDDSNIDTATDFATTTATATFISTDKIQSSKVLEPTILTPPIPKRNRAQIQQFVKRITSPTNHQHNNHHHHHDNSNNPFLNQYESSNAPLSKTHCISCGKYPPEDTVKPYSGTPLTQYGLENVVNHVCQPCLIGQGVLRHVMSILGFYVSDAHERVALVDGLKLMNNVIESLKNKDKDEIKEDEQSASDDDDDNNNDDDVDNTANGDNLDNSNYHVYDHEELDEKIKTLLHNAQFSACRHRSRTLDHICDQLSNGEIITAEFIDKLNEYANDAIGNTNNKDSSGHTVSVNETIQMKKEALMVAGDMRAAIEMLREHALPKNSSGTGYGVGASAAKGGTEMLSCVLEFFLDLCEQGELNSVAFFWTQICQIHMQMLPPTDTDSLIRVELVEDFLLTVCTKYSVHLALELVWSCLADLEESIGLGNNPSSSCRRRRFAMIRFVCELESLILHMDGLWGGGSVCLRGMFLPSEQQALVINNVMEILQLHRRCTSNHLSRSARLDKLRIDAEGQMEVIMSQSSSESESAAMDAAQRKYQIARNAEYFSTQLMFCRRLGDIADRLFFMEPDERRDTLKEDLQMLNASGRLGGDPLNRICDASSGLGNVMHIPCSEGHVFRSKERTPVLLLMEIISDQKIFENTPNSPKRVVLKDVSEKESETEDDTQEKVGEDLDDLLSHDTQESNPDVHVVEEAKNDLLVLTESVDSHTHHEYTVSPKVLQSPKLAHDGVTEAKQVGDMVASMVKEHMKSVQLPNLNNADSNDSFLSCKEAMDVSQPLVNKDKSVEVQSEKTSDQTVVQNEMDSASNKGSDDNAEALGNKEFQSSDEIDSTSNMINNAVEQGGSDQVASDQEGSIIDNQPEYISCDIPIPTNEEEKEDISSPNLIEDYNDALTNIAQQQSNSELNETSTINAEVSEQAPTVNDGTNANDNNNNSSSQSILVRKVSAFGSIKGIKDGSKDRSGGLMASLNFGANGEGRRHVLNTMFIKGMRSSNLIARNVAPAARRAVQAMDRKRAQKLMNRSNNDSDSKNDSDERDEVSKSLDALSISESESENKDSSAVTSEEDECIEALRLLLVQNRVALGKLSPENAALALNLESLDEKRHGITEEDEVDAGHIDERLAGCGPVSNAISSAISLWKQGLVNNGELLDLIQKDLQFTQVSLPGTANESILIEDSAFWGRFAFGERWAEKKSRIQSTSTFGAHPGWDLTGVIVKANDDLRQEAFAMQLIELSKEAFEIAGLELWIQPYRILATGRKTGVIEMVRNAMSFDSLKKRPGYSEGGLVGHFLKMAEHAADPTEAFITFKRNFVRSLAAYSLLSYFFLFKDRHNGNLLLDTAGHVIHIDFGFIFGIAPGGSFSLESSVPFKLTEEMIEVMDGLGSVLFSEFVTLFCCGFLAMQAHAETFITIVQITSEGSTFKCFEGKDTREIVSKLRERFCPDLNKEATIAHAMELIRQATNALGTKQYDFFQYLSQGIAA